MGELYILSFLAGGIAIGVGGAGRGWKFLMTSAWKDDVLVLDDSKDPLLIRGEVDNDEFEEE
jgi:hypothetical protein